MELTFCGLLGAVLHLEHREREELKMLPDFWIVGNMGEEIWRLKMASNKNILGFGVSMSHQG